MDTIGQRITKARERMNLNQKELCQRTGIKESTLSRYENNIREPKASTLTTIAKALDVSFDYLIGLVDDFENSVSKKDLSGEKDLEKILQTTENILLQDGITFNGNSVSKDDIQKILTALKVGVSLIDSNQ